MAMGRPTADKLQRRCAGQNRAGAHCGMAAAMGSPLCVYHMGKPDRKEQLDIAARLIELTKTALDTIEDAMLNARRYEDRVRAATVVLARTAAVANGALVNINVGGPAEDQIPVSEQIRKRLDEIRAVHERRQLEEARAEEPLDVDVIEAELVEESPIDKIRAMRETG